MTHPTDTTPKQQARAALANTIIQKLEKRNMEGYYCPTASEAVQQALSFIPAKSSVSFGGSVTLEESGMLQALREADITLIDRRLARTPQERKEVYLKSAASDFFFMSSNAITIDGELINIDGNGNRLACLIHGPEHVIILAGMNKIVTDVPSGIARVQNIATPANAARLQTNTPCKVTGTCADCHSADCMCCQVVVTRHSRHTGRIKVILIGEDLGY